MRVQDSVESYKRYLTLLVDMYARIILSLFMDFIYKNGIMVPDSCVYGAHLSTGSGFVELCGSVMHSCT